MEIEEIDNEKISEFGKRFFSEMRTHQYPLRMALGLLTNTMLNVFMKAQVPVESVEILLDTLKIDYKMALMKFKDEKDG